MHTYLKRWRALVTALVATGTIGGLVAVAAPSAHAAFPGTNGPIVWTAGAAAAGMPGVNLNRLDPTTGINTVLCLACVDGFYDIHVSADGQTIVFSQPGGAGVSGPLGLISINGGSVTTITGSVAGDNDGSFTPDGSRIAFKDAPAGNFFTIAASGGNRTLLFGSPGATAAPVLNPAGTTIAFRAGGGILETIPITGGITNQVTTASLADDQVAWSPDGTKIAVSLAAGGIAVVSATGNNQAPVILPNSLAGDTGPSWSPDGTKIVAANAGNAVIFAANGSPGRTSLPVPAAFDENDWATAVAPPGATTTTLCTGTLSGTAYKGAKASAKKALAGVVVTAGAATGTTNSAGAYTIAAVPCGTVTKSATGPDTKTRVCHFGSKSGPTTGTATVTNGGNDVENLFCLKK